MRRHLDNLARLVAKYQMRFGDDDPLVLQIKHHLTILECLCSESTVCAIHHAEPFTAEQNDPPSSKPQKGD